MRALLVAFTLIASLVSVDARAGSCLPGQSPFTDVLDDSAFCSETLWLRNANVTVGCGTGSTFCPNEPVLRTQMALFMKRLAQVLTPDVVFSATPGSGDVDTGLATCVTNTYTIPPTNANARILLQGVGNVSMLTNGAADVFVSIQQSVNGGPFLTLGVNPPRVLVPANQWTVVPVVAGATMSNGSGPLLQPGSTYQWRILIEREQSFSTTGDVTMNRCQLMMTIPVNAVL